MAKQLNVDLNFTANTSQAKQAINELQQNLHKLAYGSMPQNNLINPQQFQQAAAAAQELAFHLKQAYNSNTGNLDLSKLNTSLRQSGVTLGQLTANFANAGSIGQQAFLSVAKAVANADMPALSLNTHLSTMLITLKNVARFQISSSIIHGAIGAIKGAYGYAQDLNESLNNIRIVTGQNIDQMVEFANEANKAAKALSATTLDYTNASLIYYQQGLSDADVKARTDVTIKMANVSRQSAEEVSSQMTAIWNNFDNGSKSLEYYTDVITALGASTAASSEEIAGGLSKFAAVADTVGLSYEYAASAMATIIATTRQSEETVGNGLRTIFSRLEGLKLGETLDDGTDLNKYSAALKTIGVDILDATGNLKNMDTILDETAAHWDNLTKAQKVAFAETVGGVRQYTNLIALLDNWDTMQANLDTSYASTGTLSKQADIYAESWEAAQKRVQAAAQGVYKNLINEDFFIKFDNFLEHLLNATSGFLDKFGGLKGLIISIGGLLLSMVSTKIGPAISKVVQDIQIITGGADKVYARMQNQMQASIDTQINQTQTTTNEATGETSQVPLYSGAEAQELKNAGQLLAARRQLSMVSEKMTDAEKLRAEMAIEGLQMQQEAVLKLQKTYDDLEAKQRETKENLLASKELTTIDTKNIDKEAQRQIEAQPLKWNADNTLDTSGAEAIQKTATEAAQMLAQAREEAVKAFTSGSTNPISLDQLFQITDDNNFSTKLSTALQQAEQEAISNVENADVNNLWDQLFSLDNIDETIRFDLADKLFQGEDLTMSLQSIEDFKQAISTLGPEAQASLEPLVSTLDGLTSTSLTPVQNQIKLLATGFGDIGKQAPKVQQALSAIAKAKTPKDLQNSIKALDKALKDSKIDAKDLDKVLANLGVDKKDIEAYKKGAKELGQIFDELKQKKKALEDVKLDFSHNISNTELISKAASGFMSLYTVMNSIQTLVRTWNNPDLSFGEKLMSTFMSLGMIIPGVINLLSTYNTVSSFIGQAALRSAASIGMNAAAMTGEAAAAATSAAAHKLVKLGYTEEQASIMAAALAKGVYTTSAGRQAVIDALVTAGMNKETAAQLVNTTALSANNVLRVMRLGLSGKMTAAQLKEFAVMAKETGGVWGNTAAWIANQIAKNGWAGLILGGLLVAAILTTTAVILANTAEVEKNTKAQAEQAAASREAAQAAEEERKKQIELEQTYNEVYEKYKQTHEVTEELETATLNVAKAYEIENAQLMIAAGLYDELNEKIRENSKLKGEEAEKSLKDSLNKTSVEFGNKQSENTDEYWGSKTQVGIGDGSLLGIQSEEQIMYNAKNNLQANGGYGEFISVKESTGDLVFTTSSTSAEGYMQMYEAIAATVAEAERLAAITGEDLSKSELYTGSLAYLKNMEETYNQLKEASDKLGEISLDNLLVTSEDVTTLQQYEDTVDTYTAKLLEQKDAGGHALFTEEEARKTAENYAATQFPELTALHEALSGINEDEQQAFMALWDSASEAERQYFLQATAAATLLGETIPVAQLAAGAAEAAHIAEGLQAAADVKVWDGIIADAKKGKKTAEEWAAIYDKNADLFIDESGNKLSKADFLLMSDQQKIEYSRKQQQAAQKKADDIEEEQYGKAVGEQWRKGKAATGWAQQAAADQQALDNYLQNNASYILTKNDGTSTIIDAQTLTTLQKASQTYDEIAKKYNEGQASYSEWEAAYNDYLSTFNDAGLATYEYSLEALNNATVVEDETYNAYKNAADKSAAHSAQAQREWKENQAIRSSYEKTHNKSQEEIDAENALNFHERVEDAGLKFEDISDYADKIEKLGDNSSKSRQQVLELALATMQEAEESGIGAKKVTEYADELQKMDSFSKLNAQQLTELSLSMQQLAKDTELNVNDIASYTDYLMTLPTFIGEDVQETTHFAITMLQLNRGYESLTKNGKTWLQTLKDYPKATKEYKDAIKGLQKGLADITGLKEGFFSEQWLDEHSETVQKVINGDKDAVKDLYSELGSNYINEWYDTIIKKRGAWNAEQLKEFTNVENLKTAYEDFLTTEYPTLNPGDNIQSDSFKAALADMVKNADMSTQTIQAMFDSLGLEPDIDWIEVENPQSVVDNVNENGFVEVPDGQGGVEQRRLAGNYKIKSEGGKYYVPVINNKGNAKVKAPTGSGTTTSSGGGGGGGDKKPPKPERYHVIKNKIQNNDRRTEAVTRNKDRAAGAAKLQLLKEEQKLREKNLELQQQYAKEIEDWLAKDKEDLIKAYQDLGLAVEFDEDGEISNFEELEAAYVAFGDESDETWKKAKEALAQYEESLDLLNDKLDEIEQAAQESFDALLEEVELKVQLDIEISDDKMEYLDYLLEKIDDDAYAAAQAIALLGMKTSESMSRIGKYQQGLANIFNLHLLRDNEKPGDVSLDELFNRFNALSAEEQQKLFTEKEIEDIRNYRDEILNLNKDLMQLRKDVTDKVINTFETLNEELDKAYEKFDSYNSVLEHYNNITGLMSVKLDKQSRELMKSLSQSMFDNAKRQVASAKQMYDEAIRQQQDAQRAYDEALASGDDARIKEAKRILDAANENLQDRQDKWLEAWNNSLEQAKAIFESTMEDIVNAYNDAMSGTFGSLDYLQEAYDRQKELNEQYLQDYDRLYELSKLSRNISAAIDDTDSIKAKERLRALQAEINKLQADGTKLSEYDVQVLEKKFEIEKARLALDDAQNAKSQVRLQRDAEGNWGYVYTADEDAVAKAEQEYEDKLHEYQQLNDEYIIQLQDQALQVQQTWSETVGQIWNDFANGVIDDKEREARLNEINKWLEEQQAYFTEQSNHALDNQASLYDRTLQTYGVASAAIVDSWGETNLALMTKLDNLAAYMANWNASAQQFLADSEQAAAQYQLDVDDANEAAGVSTDAYAAYVQGQIAAIGTASETTSNQVEALSTALTDTFHDAVAEATQWARDFSTAINGIVTANEALITSLNTMLGIIDGADGSTLSSWYASLPKGGLAIETSYTPVTTGQYDVINDNEIIALQQAQIDELLNWIDLNAAAYGSGFGELQPAQLTIGSSDLQQFVTIDASFPSVTSHTEIEEAFNNLINKAAQYANRKDSY